MSPISVTWNARVSVSSSLSALYTTSFPISTARLRVLHESVLVQEEVSSPRLLTYNTKAGIGLFPSSSSSSPGVGHTVPLTVSQSMACGVES